MARLDIDVETMPAALQHAIGTLTYVAGAIGESEAIRHLIIEHAARNGRATRPRKPRKPRAAATTVEDTQLAPNFTDKTDASAVPAPTRTRRPRSDRGKPRGPRKGGVDERLETETMAGQTVTPDGVRTT